MAGQMPQQRPGDSRQDYQTPPEFLGAVKGLLEIDGFGLDIAAIEWNRVAPVILPDAFAAEVSWGIGTAWSWLNPPFRHIAPWVERAYQESLKGRRIAVLVPASVGANWWRDWVHQRAEVLFLNGRIKFVGEKDYYPKDCALLLYQPRDYPLDRSYRPSDDWRFGKPYSVWNWRTGELT